MKEVLKISLEFHGKAMTLLLHRGRMKCIKVKAWYSRCGRRMSSWTAAICAFCGILVMVGMKQKSASPQEEEEPRTQYSFRATVIKADGNHLLVEPLEEEKMSSDKISVSGEIKNHEKVETGDTLMIYYDDIILESYPAQLGVVYSIEVIK